MADVDREIHKFTANTALPYEKAPSPVTERLVWIDGSNVLTSTSEYLERRPGFGVYSTTTAFAAGEVIRRIFFWQTWSGDYFIFANTVSATQSKVYKIKIGTDADWQLLETNSFVSPVDFVAINDRVYWAGGVVGSGQIFSYWKGSGSVFGVGIDKAAAAPTHTTGAGTLDAAFGYYYVACFKNSSTGHMSSPSLVSLSTGAITDKVVNLTGARSGDAQVDQVAIFRTTDGGSREGPFFELPNSPIANPGAGSWTYADQAADTALLTNIAPASTANDPPYALARNLTYHANRMWYTGLPTTVITSSKPDTVYYSAFEEQDNGVEEESFPPTNLTRFTGEITGLASTALGLLVFTGGRVYAIRGDSLDSFRRETFLHNIGLRERATIAAVGRSIAFFASNNKIYLTDGIQIRDISKPIWGDLSGLTHSSCSMTYHNDNERNWLLFSSGSKIWVYDFDTGNWMLPWNLAVRALASGETSSGTFALFAGASSSRKVLSMTPTAYLDEGSAYTAYATLNLTSVTRDTTARRVGYLDYVAIERNSVAMSDVGVVRDEDPDGVTYTSIFDSGGQNPPLYANGTNLIAKRHYDRSMCRRISVRFDWAAANSNFKLYSIDLATVEGQR